jgi:hypothetical protein
MTQSGQAHPQYTHCDPTVGQRSRLSAGGPPATAAATVGSRILPCPWWRGRACLRWPVCTHSGAISRPTYLASPIRPHSAVRKSGVASMELPRRCPSLKLQLDPSPSFAGTVAGMSGSGQDALNLTDTSFATSGGTLSATEGTPSANIALLGIGKDQAEGIVRRRFAGQR